MARVSGVLPPKALGSTSPRAKAAPPRLRVSWGPQHTTSQHHKTKCDGMEAKEKDVMALQIKPACESIAGGGHVAW